MPNFHQELKKTDRWFGLTVCEQIAHIGSEVARAISWQGQNKEYSARAFERALDLVDMSVEDPKWRRGLKEILRLREVLCDFFAGDNEYGTDAEFLKKYFYSFNYAANRHK